MAQTFVAITTSTDGVDTGFGKLINQIAALLSCFSGATAPSSPVAGQFWLDTSTTPNILKQYGDVGAGNAWNEIGTLAKISSTVDVNWQELQNERVHNRSSAPAVDAGHDGHLYLLTTDGEIYFIDQAIDGVIKKVCSVIVGTTDATLQIPLSSWNLDATNPPTAATKGTTPTVRGLLFDAANELAMLGVRVPTNYSEDGDLKLRLWCVLDQAETASDDIDWSADLVTVAGGELVSKTSTAAAASLTDISTNNGDGAMHACDVTIDFDDANNPVAAGDWLLIEIHRTDLAEVGGVIVIGAALVYPVDGAIQ